MIDQEAKLKRIAALGFDYEAQPKEHQTACNLCGETRLVVITHQDRYGYPAPANTCWRCGLTFINPRMTASAYEAFYGGTYRPLVSAYHGRDINAQSIQAEQLTYTIEREAFLTPFLAGRAVRTMLDIGGSTGVVAERLAQTYNLTATVLDPSPDELEEARRRGLETITGLVEDADFGQQQFDFVILCQTIDHLLDIRGTLAKIRQLLAPEGLFFVDIVDFRAAYLRHWRINEALKIDHPYYLTQATAEAYLARAGFDILGKAYAADHLHISYLCAAGTPDPAALPSPESVNEQLHEIRTVQNTGHRWA